MSLTTVPAHAPESDVRELVARVAEVERSQLAEDVEGFLDLFDPDAVWVTGGGVRLLDRAAIATFTSRALPGAFASGSVRYDVEYIQFLTPDVAITGVNQEYLTAEGGSLTPRQEGRPSYVWRRDGGIWRIVVGQNTVVPAT